MEKEKVYARKVRMTNGGYEVKTGRYFGIGKPVYDVSHHDVGDYFRADDRAEAIKKFFEKYPQFGCDE